MWFLLSACTVGEDFTSLSTVVTVPPNMQSRSLMCVQVDITDDSILERDSESFTVALSHTDSAVRPSTAATLVQIEDEDCKATRNCMCAFLYRCTLPFIQPSR